MLWLLLILAGKASAQVVADTTIDLSSYVKPFSGDSMFRTWSLGIHTGILTQRTIVGGFPDFKTPGYQLGYGVYLKKQVIPSFGIQADWMGGRLQGADAVADNGADGPFAKYNTQIKTALSLSGIITLGNISWQSQHSYVQPYVSFGAGVMAFNATVNDHNGASTDIKPDDRPFTTQFFIPVGVGLKVNISTDITLDLGYSVNFVDADDLDGYKYGTTNDKFAYGHIGLEFTFGKTSTPAMATYNPVSGMRNEYLLKTRSLQKQLNGFQDKLKAVQTVADTLQNERNAILGRLNNLQKQLDDAKAQNDKLNATMAKVTTDSDGDGVPDMFDKCPNTPAGEKVDGWGCPIIIPVAAPVVKEEKTIPTVTDDDRRIIKDAMQSLVFESGRSVISELSYPSLDKVASLLFIKSIKLKLSGYTDNQGSPVLNLRLSTERAQAVKSYLVSKGVDSSLIEATGYGTAHPIASNKTAAGRKQNRRVEFSLY